jgi:methyltransferase-like protein/SAM-dependent methyltransferase
MTAPPADELVTSYDALPYESHPYSATHPDHLATMAQLFGMSPPDVDSARVLELGCAAGGNLIPLAVAIPGATFLGVDLSKRQLADGWKVIESLGLKNVELRHKSILDVGPDDGEFDYILCHGVFSWVGRDVQEKIFDICEKQLSPQGVAYISYNTNPGWYLRGMVRQMMCFHARQFEDPQSQIQQARALLDFLINAGSAGDETYHALLRRELEIIRGRRDSYLYHEHLEDVNDPLFFFEFVERAEQHNLRYLAESQFSEMVAANCGSHVDKTLRELNAGLIHTEQYLDFLRNRTFRRTLLCRHEITPQRQIGRQQLFGLYVATDLRPEEGALNLSSFDELSFRSGGGPTVTVTKPIHKAALLGLGRIYPEMVKFDELSSFAHNELGKVLVRDAESHQQDLGDLAGLVLELFAKDLIALQNRPPRSATKPGDRPAASPLARHQAAAGDQYVTTLAHGMMQLNDLTKRLLPLLDGTRDRKALCEFLEGLAADGTIVIEQYGVRQDPQQRPELLERLLDQELQSLARNGVLVR